MTLLRLDEVLLALCDCLGSSDEWTTTTDVARMLGASFAVTQTDLQVLQDDGYAVEEDAYAWTMTEEGFERVAELVEAGQ